MNIIGPLDHSALHGTIQFGVCKGYVSNMGNTFFNEIIIRRLRSEITKHTILMKFGGPLAIIVHYTVHLQFGVLQKISIEQGP